VKLAQTAENDDHELYEASKILGARYNEQEIFNELLVAWRKFPVSEATRDPWSVMALDVSEMVTKFMESHNDPNMVS
jgi:hypothetical protein